MKFFDVLYFVCLSLSFSVMWSFSEIFRPVRNVVSRIPYIRKPLICPECSSFWIGFFVSFLYNPVVLNFDILIIENIICGLLTHLFAFFLYSEKKIVDSKINFIK
jgi:hypothetical protein